MSSAPKVIRSAVRCNRCWLSNLQYAARSRGHRLVCEPARHGWGERVYEDGPGTHREFLGWVSRVPLICQCETKPCRIHYATERRSWLL